MSRSLKIAGVERWAEDYIGESLEIDLQLYGEINTCKFQVRGTEPVKGEEVLLTDSSLGVLFAGIIVRVEMREKMPGVSVPIWEVDCDDYTALLNKRLVVEDYTGWTATAIVQDICSKYCPDVTIAGVVEGAPVIEYIRFDYQTPQECFNRIAEYVNWIWDIDFTKDIKFYNLETVGDTAPMELIPGGYFRSLKHSVDIQDLRNRVYVRGGTMLSDFYTHETVADGTSRAWILPHSPHEITMAISGVQKTVGIENIHDAAEYDFLMNFQEKRITASPQTTTPVTGATITWTYKYDVDIITVIDDFISQDLLAGVQGGDGVYEHVINDDKLDTIEAAEIAGVNDLTQYANPTVKGSFETEINGWKPGQLVTISLEDRGISGMFLIQNVSIEIATDTKYTYKIQYGGKLKGVADFLKALFSAKEQTDVGETNILNKFFTESETILVTENWTFTERVLPFIVENDTEFSINNTEVRMEVQDDFTQGTLTGLTGADGTLKFTNTTVPTISQNDTLSSSNSKSGVTIRNSALELELDAPTHLSFDGVDDYIEIASVPSVSGSKTAEFWMYLTSKDITQVVLHWKSGTTTEGIVAGWGGGLFFADSTTGSGGVMSVASEYIPLNEWVHIAITKTTGVISAIYVNGVSRGISATSGWLHESTSKLLIGARFNSSTIQTFFGGKLRDVRLWGDVRTEAEIVANMNTLSNTSSLSGRWLLNEGTGTTINDSSIYGRTGTLTGGTWVTQSYVSSGQRISVPISLGTITELSNHWITWTASTPTGTSITYEMAISDSNTIVPTTWTVITKGSYLPGLTLGQSLEGKYLWLRQTLSTTDALATPSLSSISIYFRGGKTGSRVGPVINLSGVVERSKIVFETEAGQKVADEFTSFDTSKWKNAGSGTGLTINQYTEDGVSFVRFADAQAWYYYDELIPFDPTKLYVVRARVRQWTAPTIGGTSCFIGVEGVAEDRTTMIGTTGVNAHANQHYVAAAGSNLVAGSGWKEFVGYIKGYGTPINGSTSPSNPSPVYLGVAYIRPMFLFNYSGGNGSADIDYCILEMPGNIEVQTNFNGAGWQTVQSGDNIPGIVRGADLTGKTLQVQQLYSVDLPITPILHSLQIEVEEQGGAVATIGKLLKVWSKGRWQNPQYCTSEDGVTWGEWQDIQPFEVVEVPYPGYYKVRADGDVEVRNYKEPWNETDVVVGGVVVDG